MFDRIEMNVIDVSLKIGFIADRVLPIATLPNAFSRLTILLGDRGVASMPREKPLLISAQRVEKSSSPSGKIQIAWRRSGRMQIATVSKGRRLWTSR